VETGMHPSSGGNPGPEVSRFDSRSFSGHEAFSCIGSGSMGAKALGLARLAAIVPEKIAPAFRPSIHVDIPLLTVIATDAFDATLAQNDLRPAVFPSLSDEEIAAAFQPAALPGLLVEDLRIFLSHVGTPLAVRSSSLLEDAMHEPFAGVYGTKLIPNNQPDFRDRLSALLGAIKWVYASAFFTDARQYLHATGHSRDDEKLAVIIQQAVGTLQNDRFYPHISGVARSYNFYPMGFSRAEDGVVDLALGFGRIIVEEGIAWSYSPACPQANPPYNTLGELLKQSQKHFWAIDMALTGTIRPADENEDLRRYSLPDAELDGTLRFIASTYNAANDRIVMGTAELGPRLLDFAYILKADLIPLNGLVRKLLATCEEVFDYPVELEFALTFPYPEAVPARFSLLQVRPMVVSRGIVDVAAAELAADDVLVASESVLGNGAIDSIRDIVYVCQEAFDATRTKSIPGELEAINRQLLAENAPYVLIGFGRWGSSDPSAGIPVKFGQIAGARVIVESSFPGMEFVPSQGTHFFHNLTSFKVLYFSPGPRGNLRIDWTWLEKQDSVSRGGCLKHVRLASPLSIKVDGRTGRGVICK
jgi:hypothetical protein